MTTTTIDYLPINRYEQSQTLFSHNGLYHYLLSLVDQAFARYRLGTFRGWRFQGTFATCFPQFDKAGNLRQVKVMACDPSTGNYATRGAAVKKWHSTRKRYEFDDLEPVCFAGRQLVGKASARLKQCAFGEHLLVDTDRSQPIGVVEREVTAVVFSLHWPQFTWLATGGRLGIDWSDPNQFPVLGTHRVVVFPNLGHYQDCWLKADRLNATGCSVSISNWLEKHWANGPRHGDMRDYLDRTCYLPD